MRITPVAPVVPSSQTKRRMTMQEHNPTYPSVVLSKSLRAVPRTLSEANRDAEYCMAIQTFKSDTKLTMDFIGKAMYGFVVVGLGLAIPILLAVWLTK